MAEKRKLKRRHPVYYLKVVDLEANDNLGYLIDINAEGLMVAGMTSLPPEKLFNIAIHLPKEFKGEAAIYLKVKSIWSEFDPLIERTRSGFSIQEASAEELEKIRLLIENFGFKE